ncbi:MAG: hypothetical protein CL878_12585 [Dehalococcoidia bacterium]|nr:hypothetical protein [Dehalococcoidia bacterium]
MAQSGGDSGASKRKHARILLSERQVRRLKLTFQPPEGEAVESLEDISAVDFSVGGIGFSTPSTVSFGSSSEMPHGTTITIEFPAVGEEAPMEITGTVLYNTSFTVPIEGEQVERFRYGVQFGSGSEERATYALAVLRGQRPKGPPPSSTAVADEAEPEQRGPWWRRLFSG